MAAHQLKAPARQRWTVHHAIVAWRRGQHEARRLARFELQPQVWPARPQECEWLGRRRRRSLRSCRWRGQLLHIAHQQHGDACQQQMRRDSGQRARRHKCTHGINVPNFLQE